MLAFLVSLAGTRKWANSHSFLFSANPLLPPSRPTHSSPHRAIEPSKPLLPLSSHRIAQSPPPPVKLPRHLTPSSPLNTSNFLFIVALASLHRQVFLHLVDCQVAWWPLSTFHHASASFLFGWLSRRLIGFVKCPSFWCPAIEPSSRQAFVVKPSPLGCPANLDVELSNHQSVQTPLPPIKPLIRPTPSSPHQLFNPSNPFLLLSCSTPPPPIKPSSHPEKLLPRLSHQAIPSSLRQCQPIILLAVVMRWRTFLHPQIWSAHGSSWFHINAV